MVAPTITTHAHMYLHCGTKAASGQESHFVVGDGFIQHFHGLKTNALFVCLEP